MGLGPNESFEVRFSDEELIAKVFRNKLTFEESLGSLEIEAEHRRGCRADQVPRANHIKQQLNSQLDQFLERGSRALRDFHSKLVDTYLSTCRELRFSEDEVQTDIKDSIRINTNITDDKVSCMAVHDSPTETPALFCGSSNYECINGEWILKQRGGRLFVAEGLFNLEYTPRDIVILNGNVPLWFFEDAACYNIGFS